ncbi:MAG TPA: ribose-phosphate diphosphokinase, partial [Ktedonobacterales bacterium]|nr:ribose-phosphate diphosphokinase [Ktedonobacterales bacterium]
RFLSVDLHAGQIQGFFSIPVDELTAQFLLSNYYFAKELDALTIVATDAGFAKRARNFAELLNAQLAIVEKRRIGNEERTESMGLIGSVAGRHAVIVDDEIDTASSMVQAAQLVMERGALDVYAAVSHGVFSGPAIERLRASGIKEVVTTDTLPLAPEKHLPNITVLSVAELLAGAIGRIHEGRSVAELFQRKLSAREPR